jgi:hypothetical protein
MEDDHPTVSKAFPLDSREGHINNSEIFCSASTILLTCVADPDHNSRNGERRELTEFTVTGRSSVSCSKAAVNGS